MGKSHYAAIVISGRFGGLVAETNTPNEGIRTDETLKPWWWVPIASAILVFGVCVITYRPIHESLLDLGEHHVLVPAANGAEERAVYLLRETAARLTWSGLELALLISLVLGIMVCVSVLTPPLRRMRWSHRLKLGIASLFLLLAVGAVFIPLQRSEKQGIIFSFDSILLRMSAIEGCIRTSDNPEGVCPDSLASSMRPDPGTALPGTTRPLILELAFWSNFLTVAFILILVASFSVVLAAPRGRRSEFEHLINQQYQIRELLYVGAVLLVIGVIEIYGLWRWPSVHFPETQAELLDGIARAITVCFGVFFTLLLAATYVPSAMVVSRRATKLALSEVKTGEGAPAARKILKERGLVSSLAEQIGHLAAIFAPILAAFFGGPLGQLAGLI